MTFRFRQFSVEDDQSTMKVGTDGILLGAWIETGEAKNILDIGTGCGVIALMMAQRSTASVDAIDISLESTDQARSNFLASPWKDRLKALHRSFMEHATNPENKYDIILTNPPFFRNSLKSLDSSRNLARHHEAFQLTELFEAVNIMLHETGALYIILPQTNTGLLMELALIHHLPVNHILNIKPKEDKIQNRVIMKFGRTKPEKVQVDELIIRHSDNSFTEKYKELTGDFYLSLP